MSRGPALECPGWASAPPSSATSTGPPPMRRPTARSAPPGMPGSGISIPRPITGSAPASAVSGSASPGIRAQEYLVSTKVGRLLLPGPGTGDDMANAFAVPDDHVRQWDFSEAGVRTLARGVPRAAGPGPGRHPVRPRPRGGADAAGLRRGAARPGPDAGGGARPRDRCGLQGHRRPAAGRAHRSDRPDHAVLLGRYTLLEQAEAAELLEECVRHDVGIVAVSVFNSGLLAQHQVPDDATYEYAQAPAALLARARELAGIAERHGVTLPDLAVQHPLRHPPCARWCWGCAPPPRSAPTPSGWAPRSRPRPGRTSHRRQSPDDPRPPGDRRAPAPVGSRGEPLRVARRGPLRCAARSASRTCGRICAPTASPA